MQFVLWYLCIGAVFVMAMIIYCLHKKIAEDEIDNIKNLPPFAAFVGIMINAVAWPYYAYTIGKAVFHKILHDKKNGHLRSFLFFFAPSTWQFIGMHKGGNCYEEI